MAGAASWRWRIFTVTRMGSRRSSTEIRFTRRARRVREYRFFLIADDDLALVALDLDHVERRTGGDAQALALAYGEVVNAVVLADYFAVGSD